MKNIYLVGFMGTGKTAVAKMLSHKLSRPYLDLDEEIVKKEGCSINEIFEKGGETFFRKIEKQLVLEISEKNNLVVSCGGGVLLDKENVQTLKKSGIVICLNAPAEEIYERIKDDKSRPLLKVPNPLEKIKELLHIRKPYYELADHAVDTTGLSVEDITGKILQLFKV
ncbi:MAG: shikimate kinase [Candidatus Omnitrophota bacterium]